jgi:hypothetical protein
MRFINPLLLCFVLSSCSQDKDMQEYTLKYTNSPTMGDAARAAGEMPF